MIDEYFQTWQSEMYLGIKYHKQLSLTLLKYLIPSDEWKLHTEKLPKEQQSWVKDYLDGKKDVGSPMDIGYTPETGYYIVEYRWISPKVVWMEKI